MAQKYSGLPYQFMMNINPETDITQDAWKRIWIFLMHGFFQNIRLLGTKYSVYGFTP
jgi:hypothetical protein